MANEARLLIELAGGVADGRDPEWPAPSGTPEAAAISELRVIADIARVHRERLDPLISSDGAPLPSSWTTQAPEPAAWAHLKILARLGSGGFGDVYHAWDTNLGRDVALKLLRPRPGRTLRPESVLKEGQQLARVSHPNIVAVYGAQEIAGRVGIWGELLHGRTLADIIEREGPMSAKEACLCGEAICRALAAAHRQGVLHRDVKAQNVMREKGGRIVLMDFGLGLDVSDADEALRLAGSPAYMGPELFRGERPSPQSDVYSLGVLLFFLVTGTVPVTGRSLEEIADKHRRGERRRLQDLRGDLPDRFVRLVDRALAPNPSERFETCGELQSLLVIAGDSVTPVAGRRSQLSSWLIAAAIVVAVVFGAVAAEWLRPAVSGPAAVTATIEPPPGARFTEGTRNVAVLSPDGRYLAFVATLSGESRLWVRTLASGEMRALPDTVSASDPFWSPDSASLAYFSSTGLRSISLGGIRSEGLASAPEERGGTWSRDGVIVFARGPRDGLFSVSSRGGTPQQILSPDHERREIGLLWPHFLADGQRFIFFVWSNDERVRGVYMGRLGSGERTRLFGADTSAIVAGDELLFVRDGVLAAHRFDPDRQQVVGPARLVISGVGTTFTFRTAASASATGLLVYTPPQAADLMQMTWVDPAGNQVQVIDGVGRFRNPAVSADGRYLAVQQYRDSISELRVFDLQRGGQSRIPHPANAEFPAWSRDGRLAFAASDRGWLDIYVLRVDGSVRAERLFESDADKMPNGWSPDGKYLSFTSLGRGGSYDLHVLPVSPPGPPITIADSEYAEADGHFSPDGRRLAYISTASTRPEVYVRGFPSGTAARRISTHGGVNPAWSSDSSLLYLDLSGQIMRVQVPADERAPVPAPVAMFKVDLITAGSSRNHFSLAPDATRILVNRPASSSPTTTNLTIIANWPSLLPQS